MSRVFAGLRRKDPRILYRGQVPSRLDNLTDAVFGIAITLLIFNLADPGSFAGLVEFTWTLPAFLLGIGFLMVVWSEHQAFSDVYTLDDGVLRLLNTLFIALVIFYVYPLRFVTLFLTDLCFRPELGMTIQGDQVPLLMIYYGFVAFGLYFTLFLFHLRAWRLEAELELDAYENFHTRSQLVLLAIMSGVPLISIVITGLLKESSVIWASALGGATYCLYTPAMFWWLGGYRRRSAAFPLPSAETPPADRLNRN